jgi:hypothetical protein
VKFESILKNAVGDNSLYSEDELTLCLANASVLFEPVSWNDLNFGFNFDIVSITVYD